MQVIKTRSSSVDEAGERYGTLPPYL